MELLEKFCIQIIQHEVCANAQLNKIANCMGYESDKKLSKPLLTYIIVINKILINIEYQNIEFFE